MSSLKLPKAIKEALQNGGVENKQADPSQENSFVQQVLRSEQNKSAGRQPGE
jgi:hypothetical protein